MTVRNAHKHNKRSQHDYYDHHHHLQILNRSQPQSKTHPVIEFLSLNLSNLL